MRKQNKLLALVLAMVCVLSLTACGREKKGGTTAQMENGKQVWYMGGTSIIYADVDAKTLFTDVQDTVDPARIYQTVEWTPELLRGSYVLNNKEKDLKDLRKNIPFQEVNFKSGPLSVSTLPVAVYLGQDYICSSETRYKYGEFEAITDKEVAVLELATADQVGQTPCIYEISGNTITFKQIEQTSNDQQPFAYNTTGVEFSYTFQIAGPNLTFSKDGHSVQLKSYCFTENCDSELSMHGYSLPDSPLVANVDYFASADAWNYAVKRDGAYFDQAAYKLDGDGRFTVYYAEKDLQNNETEKFVGQFAYVVQSDAGNFLPDFSVVLFDGEKIYRYTDDLTMREARALEEQGVNVGELTDEEIEQIAEKKADLFDDLYEAFETNGINATINRSTGEIALDSTVLFDVNESAVSAKGKEFLQKFMQVYASVVFSDKYENFVSTIMVEGHTDTNGDYDMNKKLSQDRADSVKEYCLSAECGVDASYADALKTMLKTEGHAYDKPVYDANGEVDMDASRRVSFRFIVNIQK